MVDGFVDERLWVAFSDEQIQRRKRMNSHKIQPRNEGPKEERWGIRTSENRIDCLRPCGVTDAI